MSSISPPAQSCARVEGVVVRALGVSYLVALLSLIPQLSGLIGSRGILPAARFLEAVEKAYPSLLSRYAAVPTLGWISASDFSLVVLGVLGSLGALLMVVDRISRLGAIVAWVCYLSLISLGQEFLMFQWDTLLLEAGILAFFIPNRSARAAGKFRPIIIWCFRILVFRLMVSSGAVKLLADGTGVWSALTALKFHYETQPLPNPIAWYFELLPLWAHKVMTCAVLGIEILVPFLIFCGRRARNFAAIVLIGLQFAIALTGNFAFFNLLTIAITISLFDDAALFRSTGVVRISIVPSALGLWRGRIVTAILGFIILLNGAVFIETLGYRFGKPYRSLYGLLQPFCICNHYGLFASMTLLRDEIEIEGSMDGSRWETYLFRWKIGPLDRMPPIIAPLQPRLDWQLWFAALSTFERTLWMRTFFARILEGSPAVLALMEKAPFEKPRYLRARLYRYHFTTWSESRESGNWWRREFIREYSPVVGLTP